MFISENKPVKRLLVKHAIATYLLKIKKHANVVFKMGS